MGSDDSHPANTHRATPEAAETESIGELSTDTRYYLGDQLRAFYTTVLSDAQPQHLLDLLTQLDAALAARQSAESAAFRQGLHDALPSLRAFAISLTANAAQADDLVQNTLLKAWTNQHRFAPGTNLIAWLMTIARNTFYTERRRKREVEDVDGVAAGQLIALPCQEHAIALQQVWQAMAALPTPQREALMLVGAQGMTYEAAAELLACQVGTVKSRVSRARSSLADTLALDRQRA